ncbi:putative disease resistance protein RGA3 isoform X2 [Spinacia oleracea]|uniref:Disease resistance protein RGA3 isoform X2 n=1 Tax=Spinacia oleracea TaxID=3562 RepID=A0A9R0JTT6_SPIOL|nr:putative disease resistance protein RGA3 isoform X2 [Spinacia oleracea]
MVASLQRRYGVSSLLIISWVLLTECHKELRMSGRSCMLLEDDRRAVLDMLLDSSFKEDFCFLSIVGAGGVGKTTLAQLVYNDEKVKSEFDLRLWACVSDQDGEQFEVKPILAKILESAVRQNHDNFGLDLLQNRLQEVLGGKKYLLVLDDVWNEDRYKWLELRKFLMIGGCRGSKILITTRSKQTARVVGNEYTYELKGLSDENSWHLFEMAAFDKGYEQVKSGELVDIRKKIVKRCVNVPLALKVVGSLLFGQDESKWRSFQEIGLAKISNGENQIMSILKISYHNLEFPLKSCFSYCALFPKGFVIEKERLISLWMAQGYIVPIDGGQSIEDAGEEYFSILLRRCFFQDVKMDQYGEVVSCKIHDLMHEVAEEVAGMEIWVGTCITSALERKNRHLFHVGSKCTQDSFTKMKIRSYLRSKWVCTFPLHVLIANWSSSIRTLDLHNLNIKCLPDSMGKLVHLRYLDLSNNKLKRLPNSFTRLHNLQSLNLAGCYGFEELPKDISKMVKLRHLDISHCKRLTYMSPGIDKLTCLQVLTAFVVANGSSTIMKQNVGQLKDLKAFKNLKGCIRISIPEDSTNINENDIEGGYLKNMEKLKGVCIHFELGRYHADGSVVKYHEALLEKIQPHPNLRGLNLFGYQGNIIPRWGRADDNWASVLPNLVKIEISSCRRLQHLPSLSKLAFLKSLQLYDLSDLEYMENTTSSNDNDACGSLSTVREYAFFPSLEVLNLDTLPNLKGWWRQVDENSSQWQPSFPRLSRLLIRWCHSLISWPSCPSVETLCMRGLNGSLQVMMGKDAIRFIPSHSRASGSDTKNSHLLKLREVEIDNMNYLKSLPTHECLTSIKICSDDKLKNLSEVEEVLKSCCSLRNLTISNCVRLRRLSGGLEHLTALESLSICRNPKLSFSEEEVDGMPWRSLHQSLHSLEFKELENLTSLPEGMQHLTTLRNLTIDSCWNLKALPEWLSCLSSLQLVQIKSCYHLKSVFDAYKIQHIPSISIVHD